MIVPIVKLLTHVAWIYFSKLVFLSALVFAYSNASNFHILLYHGPILYVRGVHQIKLILM